MGIFGVEKSVYGILGHVKNKFKQIYFNVLPRQLFVAAKNLNVIRFLGDGSATPKFAAKSQTFRSEIAAGFAILRRL